MLFKYTSTAFLLLFSYAFTFSQGIYNTATIVVSGSTTIMVQDGGFHNNGNFVAGLGTVVISGTAATNISAIGGSSATAFNHLIINKTSNEAGLSGNISVDGNLTMQAGNLDMNLFNIDLGSGPGKIMNENNAARIMGAGGGNIIKTINLNAPVSVNPGNMGIAISSAADLGNTVVKRGYRQQTIPGNGQSIYRYYDIVPANNASLNATLQMYYFNNELAGINKNDLNFYRSEDNGVSWTFIGKDNSDQTNDWVLKNNISQLSRWTLAANTSALPVKLISFTAAIVNRETNLQWITAQEINSSYFDVQRSGDGLTFTKLLSIPAQVNSNSQNTYHAVDANPIDGINYYRLREVDMDGTFSFSPVVQVKLTGDGSYSVFPNPAQTVFYLNIYLPAAQQQSIALYDANGQLLEQKNVQLNAGSNQLQWNISRLAKGIYFLKSTNTSMPVIKVVKP